MGGWLVTKDGSTTMASCREGNFELRAVTGPLGTTWAVYMGARDLLALKPATDIEEGKRKAYGFLLDLVYGARELDPDSL